MTAAKLFTLSIKMARPKRFELLTPRFVVWCSIQLSYGRAPDACGRRARATVRAGKPARRFV